MPQQHNTRRQLKQPVGSESKAIAAIPGSPDRTTTLQKRLSKTEKELLSIKTRIACERASWERRFAELQRQQEVLHNQLVSQVGVMGKEGSCDDHGESGADNGVAFEPCSIRGHGEHPKGLTEPLYPIPQWTWSSVTRSGLCLPSGRISTGTIRFLGYLQGEAELQLGVELQTPDPGLHDGSHKGYSYFECKPGYGAFVPFHKLLMVWE
ncbi:Tubulin-specific chaperone E [Larimichthys crocea]|uniref:Uncharacterized protein n=1 Tax=Larimichthys crocea TaxID=215358 RepID=A0ACD3QXU7_LARCR|nr:Tubulin-specific chaperone E [Larimichthys crocea]